MHELYFWQPRTVLDYLILHDHKASFYVLAWYASGQSSILSMVENWYILKKSFLFTPIFHSKIHKPRGMFFDKGRENSQKRTYVEAVCKMNRDDIMQSSCQVATINPIQDGRRGTKWPLPTCFSPVTSTSLICSQTENK